MTVDLVVEVEGAHQPVERVGAAGRAQLLRERRGLRAERRLDQRGGARLGVLFLQALDLLVGRDRGDGDIAHVPLRVERATRGFRLDPPVAIIVTGPGIAVGVAIAEAVGAGPGVELVEHEVGVAVHRTGLLVRSQRNALLAIVAAAGRRLVLPRADGGVVVRVVADQQDPCRIRRFPQQLAAKRLRVALIVVGHALEAVFGPAVVLLHRGRNATRERVAERAAERSLRVDLVVLPEDQVGVALERVGRPPADEVNQPARRVTPEQRALRPAQHLDALEVEELEGQPARGRAVHVVDVHRDRILVRVCEIVQPDAAQEEVDHARFGVRRRIDEAGRHRHDVRRVRESELADLLVGERGDRDADVLQGLLALLRCDDDFLEGRRSLRRGRAGQRDGYGDEDGA